jgi:uncharacterized coiled-coil protein SlyX
MADESRLMELEIKVAYLEKLFGELDLVVREQADRLSALARDLERQRSQGGSLSGAEMPDDKPPHY